MTFSDGQSSLPETPRLNKIYEGPNATVYLHVDHNNRIFIHSVLPDPHKLSNYKFYKQFLKELEIQLEERGATEYYTMADSQMNFDFCTRMGFETAMEVWDNKYEVMRKAL